MKYLEDEKLLKLTSELTDVVLGRSRSIHGRIEAYTMKRAGTDKKYAHALGARYVADLETVETQLAEYRQFMQRHSRFEEQSNNGANVRTGRKRSMSTGSQLESEKSSKQQRPRSNSHDASMSSSSPGAVPQSALGDFGEIGTRRLMTDLILTLNSSFPDYDFGGIKPTDFEKIGVTTAVNRVNERLAEVAVSKASILSDMWSAMDDALQLSECEVYSYDPKTRDQDDEPLGFLTQTLIDPLDHESSDDTSMSNGGSATVLWTFNYFFVNKSRKRIVFFTCVECMRSEGSNLDDDEVSFVQFPGTEASDVDFDLDPSAGVAGGIPIEIV